MRSSRRTNRIPTTVRPQNAAIDKPEPTKPKKDACSIFMSALLAGGRSPTGTGWRLDDPAVAARDGHWRIRDSYATATLPHPCVAGSADMARALSPGRAEAK